MNSHMHVLYSGVYNAISSHLNINLAKAQALTGVVLYELCGVKRP